MSTISRTVFALLFAGGMAFGAAGCDNGGNKCEQAFDSVSSLLADELGEEMAAHMEDEMDEAVEECEEALAENPDEVEEALDCLIGADSAEDLEECPDPTL